MKGKLIRVQANSRFHFGKASIDHNTALANTDTFIHSDVLFSALVNNLAQVERQSEVDKFVTGFNEGLIKISSGFYCIENTATKEIVPLIPRPVTAVNMIDMNDYDKVKKTKSIKFVCLQSLQRSPKDWAYYKGVAIDKSVTQRLGLRANFELYHTDITTKVGIYKSNDNADGPYFVNSVQIADQGETAVAVHFYFLYEVKEGNEDLSKSFELAASLIPHNGLGGERSSGCGQVNAIEDLSDTTLALFDQITETQMTMGMTIPKNVEELNSFLFYNYSTRGGRKSEDGRLQSVRMISEGALFNGNVEGNLVDIEPDKKCETKYKRNGKCFAINIPDIYNLNKKP